MLKKLIKLFFPPILLDAIIKIKKKLNKKKYVQRPSKQELDLYYNPEMAKILDEWGERNAWIEIQHLLHGKKSNILDIACGTGKVIEILKKNNESQIFGCDISELLISKCIERGIDSNKLQICDATNLPYKENEFDYCYSIGSLEHFTEDGIIKFLESSKRVTKFEGFHMIPVSKSNKDEGWINNYQSYFNNSSRWWIDLCKKIYSDVKIIDSTWEDEISTGKWLILKK